MPENSQMIQNKPKLLIHIVAYHAEKTIRKVLARIPLQLLGEYYVEVLVIDDASKDQTFEHAYEVKKDNILPFKLHVLYNPSNQGYGGSQKLGYLFAIKNGFDYVALLHGDGQYAPECLPDLIKPLRDCEAEAVFGSRMIERKSALKGGMPLYKFVGNTILSWFENRMLRTRFSEFHSGYRVYSVNALKKIPFQLNTNDFHFDTEIIIQFIFAGFRIKELPIPTYYGDEICYVNGLKYAFEVVMAVVKARAQEMALFYDRRFDCTSNTANAHYQLKVGFISPHSICLEKIKPNSRVLDLGCAGGYMSGLLKTRLHCRTTGVDVFPPEPENKLDKFILHDLSKGLPDVKLENYDYVLLLDVLEHFIPPEDFVDYLKKAMSMAPDAQLLISTANIGFFITRVMLLFGQFNYGKRGILDITHARLFTFSSLKRLFEQAGFIVNEVRGIPGPYPLAIGDNFLSRFLLWLNGVLIRLSKTLFSYQIFMVVSALPSVEYLLAEAHEKSAIRINQLSNNGELSALS